MTDRPSTHLLICFDGSENARRAIEHASRLFPGATATIAYAWPNPVYATAGYMTGGAAIPLEVDEEIRQVASEHARELAEAGEDAARAAGLVPEAQSFSSSGPAWRVLLALAGTIRADVIVAGSRGRSGIKSAVLGSTTSALAHHSQRPVLIIPPEPES